MKILTKSKRKNAPKEKVISELLGEQHLSGGTVCIFTTEEESRFKTIQMKVSKHIQT